MEARDKAPREYNSYTFKKLANLNLPTYDGALTPKSFEDWIQGMEKLFDAMQCPEEWRVGRARFYIMEEPDLW